MTIERDAAIAAIGSKATFTGATTSVLAWFTSSEFGVLAGVALGVLGLLVNWYFKNRTDRRDQAEHEARIRRLDEARARRLDK